MTTTQANIDGGRTWHFRALDPDQQSQVLRRLSLAGQFPYTIASATGLSVEQVLLLLAQEQSA